MIDNLSTIVNEYVAARDLCPKHAERLRQHVRDFDSWHHSREYRPANETPSQRLNGWIASLVAVGLSPVTVNNHRQSIVTLLRFATPDDVPLPRTDRIRRQREPEKVKPAYRLEEIRQLIAAAPSYDPVTCKVWGRGKHRKVIRRHRPDGVPWSVWWEAYIRVAYGSGQYLSDLRYIPWESVGPDGLVTFVRRKTGQLLSFRLNEQAIAAAKSVGHPKLLLPWQFDVATYFAREWRKFCAFAGVRALGPKSLRRAAITAVYIEQGPEAARQLAGHSSFAITSRHYIDWSIAGKPVVEPPAI